MSVLLQKRRPIRAPINSMDKHTVVSIYPREINERKETLDPGIFHIDPGSYENPSVLVVGTSSYWRELDPEQPLVEIPVGSILIAESIVRDYCNGIFGCDMDTSMPGLFFVPGELEGDEVKKKYPNLLEKAKTKQDTFFNTIIKLADILWARTNGNPLSISEDARMAAREMGFDRPWMQTYKALSLEKCPACGSLRDPVFPICPNCKAIIDLERYKELGLKTAS